MSVERLYNTGDKIPVIIEIESVTVDYVSKWMTNIPEERTLYKIKGIPVYLEEKDFLKFLKPTLHPIEDSSCETCMYCKDGFCYTYHLTVKDTDTCENYT